MSKLVSIIVPVYNGESFIADCINSILNQTYLNYEIIVVNDGSIDNTRFIIESFDNDRIRLFNIENNGVSNARNYGMNRAQGEFVLFVDADDRIENNTLELLVKIQEENDADIIRFNGFIQDADGKFKVIDMPVENNTILYSNVDCEKIVELLNSPYGSIRCYSPLLFIRNSDIINFDTTLAYLEDKLFYLENMTTTSKKIMFINMPLYYYNFNERSKTKDINNFIKNVNDLILAMNKISEAVEKLNLDSKIVKDSVLSLIIYRIDYLASITSYKEFKNIINQVFDINEFVNLINLKGVKLKKLQMINYYLLKYKMLLILYFIYKVKGIVKELKK